MGSSSRDRNGAVCSCYPENLAPLKLTVPPENGALKKLLPSKTTPLKLEFNLARTPQAHLGGAR